MNRVDTPQRIVWRLATVVTRARDAEDATIVFDVPEWPGHRAGQHVDVRLTSEDGYQAERSYSIASPPEDSRLSLTVEKLEDGEVSPYLSDDLRAGDQIELRGPIGGYFVWDVSLAGPLLLVAGGSGIVPLMAMLRHRDVALERAGALARHQVPTRLLYSSRKWDEVIYRDESHVWRKRRDGGGDSHPHARGVPEWTGLGAGSIEPCSSRDVAGERTAPGIRVRTDALVESVAGTLVELGHEPARVKTSVRADRRVR